MSVWREDVCVWRLTTRFVTQVRVHDTRHRPPNANANGHNRWAVGARSQLRPETLSSRVGADFVWLKPMSFHLISYICHLHEARQVFLKSMCLCSRSTQIMEREVAIVGTCKYTCAPEHVSAQKLQQLQLLSLIDVPRAASDVVSVNLDHFLRQLVPCILQQR